MLVLLNDDEVCILSHLQGVIYVVIGSDDVLQFRIRGAEGLQPGISVVAEQVVETPLLVRLRGDDLVATVDQFAENTAEKMRVAVVPAGPKRVRKINDLHAATSRGVFKLR